MSALEFDIALDRFTNFGDLLKYLRRRTGLTQRELSIAVGYSHVQISRLELNQRSPDLATITARFIPVLDLEDKPKIASRLIDLAAMPPAIEPPAGGAPPYKGLQFYEEGDASQFHGREELTRRVVDRLVEIAAKPKIPNFLAVIGSSGSGKSSLVRAGLVPGLRRTPPFSGGNIIFLTPGYHPVEALAASLVPPGSPAGTISALMDDMLSDDRSLKLAAAAFAAGGMQKSPQKIQIPPVNLLVIDQFEELFTLCEDEAARRAFIENLMTAVAESGSPIFVLIALRADFYGQCAPYPGLRAALAAQQEFIGPMDLTALRRAIEKPAQGSGWKLESGLVEMLLQDVRADETSQPEPGFLPLLSHALLETWRRRSGRRLTVSGYLATGGVSGALADTAGELYYDVLDDAQRILARRIFLRLVQPGDYNSGLDTRRRADLDELIHDDSEMPAVQEVLDRLVEARLVVTNQGTVELAHEALIRAWSTLRGWLDQDREGILIHRHLTQSAAAWGKRDKDPGELYRGSRLAQAASWGEEHSSELSASEQEYLASSAEHSARVEAEREMQRQRELAISQTLAETQREAASRLRRRAVYLSIAFVLALAMGGIAVYQGGLARQAAVTAQNQARLAFGRELAAASVSSLLVDPERSLMLALQAASTTHEVDGTVLPEAEEALHGAILGSRVRQTLIGHDDWILSIAYSPDGKRLASIERSGTTIVWDAARGEELFRMSGITTPGDANGYQRITYSPDGSRLVTGDANLVRIWDADGGRLLMELAGHSGDVWEVAFSPDGKLLASSGADGSVRIWDALTGESLRVFDGHELAVESIAFRPGSQQLATASDDQTVKVWVVSTGQLVAEQTGYTGEVYGVAYSPDGKLLAVGNAEGVSVWDADELQGPEKILIPEASSTVGFSPDGTRLAGIIGSLVKVWDARTGQELLSLAGHNAWVDGFSFHPDGNSIATSSSDKTIKIWRVTPGEEKITLPGWGTRAVYSPNGTRIASAGNDGSVQIWNSDTGEKQMDLTGHAGLVLSLAFSPDGNQLASASFDQTAKVWDTGSGELLLTLAGHDLAVRDVAYSPDGKVIATGSFDQTAVLWDAQTGEEMKRFTGHTGLVLGVAFSPDGARLATSSTDLTTRVWDIPGGHTLFSLEGHQRPIPDVTYSPDGRWIVTASQDGTAAVWDSQTGKIIRSLAGHTTEIQSVVFSADGRLLATASGDNTAKVWDPETGAEIHSLPGSLGGVLSAAFDPRGKGNLLAVGSQDGIVRVFLLGLDDLLTLARSRVTRDWMPWECQKYLHQETCPPATPTSLSGSK